MLVLSIVLHGMLIFIPAPHESSDDASELAETSIQITRLPELTNPAPTSPSPPVPSEPNPELTAEFNPPQPADGGRSAPPHAPPSASTIPSAPPSPPPTPASTANSEPSAAANPAAPPLIDTPLPFANFPQLANAEGGCFGLENCHQVEDGNFRQVGARFIEQLRDQGYRVDPREDLEETGTKVYEVTQDETTQYLTVLSPELGVAVYVLAAEPVTVSKLQEAEAFSAEFQQILAQVADGSDALPTQLPYPQSFSDGTTLRSEIRPPMYWVRDVAPDRLAIPLTNQLGTVGFAVESVGEHGGVPLYQVSQGAFAAYLSIVPATNQTGSILVAWHRLPI